MKAITWVVVLLVAGAAGAYYGLARRRESGNTASAMPAARSDGRFLPRAIGEGAIGLPWVIDLQVADLDRDGLPDVLACDGRRNRVSWIRQVARGEFQEHDLGEPIAGPAHVEVSDLDGDGDLDVLVAGMGIIPPTNAKTGAVVVLVNDGANRFTNRVLLEQVARVTYVAAADFNRDGRLDLAVGQFGYIEGEIRWMENLGDWQFRSRTLLDLPGTIHAPPVDLNGDGNMDIVALVTQDSEEVHAFYGDGAGGFRNQILYGSTNRDYGSSGLTIADVDRDGRPDVVYTNGDGFDYATPGPRPWHGVQWLKNLGEGRFAYARVADFPGAYSPAVADVDGDGDHDIVACSAFNDWKNKGAVSLMWFENDGQERFTSHVVAHQPTHLIVVKAADVLRRGPLQLVTGALMFYPPYESVSRVTLWEPKP